MADINVDEIGPVRADHERTGSHEKLIDSNTIRVLDLVMIMKAEDGSVARPSYVMPTTVGNVISPMRCSPKPR